MHNQQRETHQLQPQADENKSGRQLSNEQKNLRRSQQQQDSDVDSSPEEGGGLNSPGLNQGFETNESEDEADRRERSEDTDRPVRAP